MTRREVSTGVRAGVVGLLAPLLGAAAHVEAGGPIVPSPAVVATGLAVAAVTGVLARWTAGAAATTAVLAAGQVVWHLALSLPGAHAAPGAHGMPAMHAPASSGPADTAAGVLAGVSPAMVAAHTLTTIVVALGVVGADRALVTAVASRVRWRLRRVRGGVPATPAVRSRPIVVVPAQAVRRRRVLVRTAPRRGPPVPA